MCQTRFGVYITIWDAPYVVFFYMCVQAMLCSLDTIADATACVGLTGCPHVGSGTWQFPLPCACPCVVDHP
jgi:hypothetical protein